eukprot:gb/GEZJ01008920.1/.p1 GENE.gb/GEZJ01008920.1/~~gb/GEZJ01008920.1/.p1  ORF type:complete len:104 (-),score=9.31 gb/GEZJ01008920.1/:105-416(-)
MEGPINPENPFMPYIDVDNLVGAAPADAGGCEPPAPPVGLPEESVSVSRWESPASAGQVNVISRFLRKMGLGSNLASGDIAETRTALISRLQGNHFGGINSNP